MRCFAIGLALLTFPTATIPPGPLSEDTLRQHHSVQWSDLNDRVTVFHDQESNLDGVEVELPAGGWGSQGSGAQILFTIPSTLTATCEYQVRFEPEFDFVRGGKLPGLAGGNANSGGEIPDGRGWSARFMWRRSGQAVLYLYHLDQASKYGDDFPLHRNFKAGTWHRIKQTVAVNTASRANGRIQVWFDDELVLDLKDVRLQKDALAPIDRFFFSTFFGGNGQQWAPQQSQKIRFANFKVYDDSVKSRDDD